MAHPVHLKHALGGFLGEPFAAAVCCRRSWTHNLKSVRRLGTKHGGVYADGIHFRYQGGQVRSLLSLLSYLGSGEYRKRYFGVKIPPTNVQDYHLEAAANSRAAWPTGFWRAPANPSNYLAAASRSEHDSAAVGKTRFHVRSHLMIIRTVIGSSA
jgi:hypothetical protein